MEQRLLELERQLFHQWYRWREGQISRDDLHAMTTPFIQAIKTISREVSDLGFANREKTPWASTVRTCRQILKVAPALWTFLDHPDVERTNNAAERARRPVVNHHKLS
jgi:hypothetical protein